MYNKSEIATSLLSIEISHVCAGKHSDNEPEISLNALRGIRGFPEQNVSYACLMDDMGDTLGLDMMIERLKSSIPDNLLIARESSFAENAHAIFAMLPSHRIRKEYFRKSRAEMIYTQDSSVPLMRVDENGPKPLCALLSSAWNVTRLGILPWPNDALIHGNPVIASKLLNVLPDYLVETEMVAVSILDDIGYQGLCDIIGYSS